MSSDQKNDIPSDAAVLAADVLLECVVSQKSFSLPILGEKVTLG